MKKNLNKIIFATIVILILAPAIAVTFFHTQTDLKTESIKVKTVERQILADGTVESASTAILHFQVGGKLTYLPVKEGDQVFEGQTIAQLDANDLQNRLTMALNNYKIQRDSFDQTQQNSNDRVLWGQQRFGLETQNRAAITTGPEEENIVNDMIKRILEQNQANLDNSVINVQLANSALQLSALTSPINGVITHLDVTNAGTNITPATSFVVADPSNLVFEANVPDSMINYVSIGGSVKVKITSGGQEIDGTVSKIYPQRITLPTGSNVYKVEINCPNLVGIARMNENGTVLIQSNLADQAIIIPSWTILANSKIWVLDNGKPVLKTVKTGKTLGTETEILEGLKSSDRVIVNPESIVSSKYSLL